MPANLDLMKPAAAALPGRIERNQPEARSDRWKLELERAALAGGAKGGARHAGARGEQATPAAAQDRAAPGATHATHAPRAAPADGQGEPLQAYIQPLPRVAAVAGGAAPAAVPARAAAAAGVAAAPGMEAQPVLHAGVVLARLDAGPAGGHEELRGAAAPAAPRADETYARSLLHVYRADDGVHAWIRDAGLSQEQVRRVATAMAGEFAQSGAPLAGLTVNGKRIMSPGAAGRYDEAAPAVRPLTQFAVKGA